MTGNRLGRRLGLADAVTIGLGSMIGAGVFAAFGPAARAAGSGLLLGLALAALVAYCNATSSARLAALYPESGGSYVYGRRRLGVPWGVLAGWAFLVGKLASCAAMGLTVGAYLLPAHERLVGVLAVLAVTAVNYCGVRRSLWVTRVILAVVGLVLAGVVVAAFAGGTPSPERLTPFPGTGVHGVLESAGLLFFAFAGYARIATLGEEVRAPERTIPRAIPIALAITLAVYALVGVSALLAVGPAPLAGSNAPLRTVVDAGSLHALAPAVRVGGTVAALGSLLSLVLGISRTALAMARDGQLPRRLAAVHPRFDVPHRAEVAAGVLVCILIALTDLRAALGISSFSVLLYYGVANASAATLSAAEGRPPRWVPVLGLVGCVVLALSVL